MDVVSEGELRRARAAGVPADKIIFSGVGKTRAEMALGLDEGILCFNVESEPELEALVRGRRRARTRRAHRHSRQPGRRRTHPRQDLDRQGRKTSSACRSRAPAPSTPAPARCPASPSTGVDMHIGSQITDMQPFDDAFALLADFVRDAARRRPRHRPRRPRRRPRHPLSRRQRSAAPSRALRRDRRAPHPRPRLQALFRAGPADRRQRRRAGDLGPLRQARRRQELRHRRCGDERPHPADALRRPSRDPAARRAAGSTRARLRADVVGPVCESGDFLALDREMAGRARRAICWR